MTWIADSEDLKAGLRRLRLFDAAGDVLGYGAVLAGWRDDTGFRTFFNSLLCDAPFQAFLWETPPITRHSLERPFECVLVDSPGLARFAPDRDSFAEHFAGAGDQVLAFPNLGHDAMLIVPCPLATDSAYTHLAAFARKAPPRQRQAFWRHLGETAEAQLSDKPLWISTNGLGVAWLHARLDSRPKYYSFAPYREAD